MRFIVESETDTIKVFSAPEMVLGSLSDIYYSNLLMYFTCFWFTKIPAQKQVL